MSHSDFLDSSDQVSIPMYLVTYLQVSLEKFPSADFDRGVKILFWSSDKCNFWLDLVVNSIFGLILSVSN